MAMTQVEIQRRSDAKRGIKKKAFSLHTSDIALIERLAAHMGQSQVATLMQAVRELAARQQLQGDA